MANKVGGEVDAVCNKCKMSLAHTILAMVGSKIARVRCNTCMGEHAYRGNTIAPSAARAAKARAEKKEERRDKRVVIGWEQRLAGKDLDAAPKYSPQATYAVDQLINHPTFGIGIVSSVRLDKVEVAFKGDTKTLVHGRGGGAPAARPAYQAPKAQRSGPADKPISDEEAALDQQEPAPEAETEAEPSQE